MHPYTDIHASECACPSCEPWHPADGARLRIRARLVAAATIAILTAALVAQVLG